tara:strand:- start:3715 stop:4431 length:717 start_codon:yes stop_codon:yes gene_type:complete
LKEDIRRLEGRYILITGASRGIGAAVARRYAKEGAHLILIARTTGALEELDDEIQSITGAPATLIPMDLTDFEKIDHAAAALNERFGRLDVLVGNAGILGSLGPLGHADPRLWDQVMAINLTANWRLIRAMDPLLRRSDSGRAIFVTSTVGGNPRAYWSAYAVSKAALEMAVRIYAKEITGSSIRCNLINPGSTRTAMRAQAMPGENPMNVKPPEALTDAFVSLAEPECTNNGALVTC